MLSGWLWSCTLLVSEEKTSGRLRGQKAELCWASAVCSVCWWFKSHLERTDLKRPECSSVRKMVQNADILSLRSLYLFSFRGNEDWRDPGAPYWQQRSQEETETLSRFTVNATFASSYEKQPSLFLCFTENKVFTTETEISWFRAQNMSEASKTLNATLPTMQPNCIFPNPAY